MNSRGRRTPGDGFVLLPVVLLIAVVAMVALAVNHGTPVAGRLALGEVDATRARLVAEAGMQHAVWRAHRNACSGYDLGSTSFGAHSYTVGFTPASGSPVSLLATGRTAAGASATLRRDSVKVHDGVYTIVLQPGPADGQDTYLSSWSTTGNYGGVSTLYTYPGENRLMVRFDLSAIPPGSEVRSARMELKQESAAGSGGGESLSAYRITGEWTEGTGTGGTTGDGATWNTTDGSTPWSTPGGDLAPTPAAVMSTVPGAGWKTWDLSALVADWVSGAQPNHGVMLMSSAGLGYIKYASSDDPTIDARPKLIVSYYGCECGGGFSDTLVLDPGFGLRDTYLDDGAPDANHGTAARLLLSGETLAKQRALLRFDLGTLLPNASVTSAVLEANLESIGSAADTSITAYALQRDWSEGSATWNSADGVTGWTTPGADFDAAAPQATAPAYHLPSSTVQPVQWQIGPLVRDWVSGAGANNGLVLVPADGASNVALSSGDSANPLHPTPRLTLHYSCPCGEACTLPPLSSDAHYLDGFVAACSAAEAYTGSQGTLDWSGQSWAEVDDSNPCGGSVRLESDLGQEVLTISGDSVGLERAVDLSGFGGTTLRLLVRRDRVQVGDSLSVEVSADGVTWEVVHTVAGPGDDSVYQAVEVDITAWAGPATRIRLTGNSFAPQATFLIDEVRIDRLPPSSPTQTMTAAADATLKENSPDTALGTENKTKLSQDRLQSLYRFDLSTVPPGTLISGATLRLHVKTHGNQSGGFDSVVRLYKLLDPATRDWTEAEATWNARQTGLAWPVAGALDGTLPEAAQASLPRGTEGVWMEFDVTALAQEWIDFPAQNLGVVATLNKSRTFEIYSREDPAIPSLAPQLVVTF